MELRVVYIGMDGSNEHGRMAAWNHRAFSQAGLAGPVRTTTWAIRSSLGPDHAAACGPPTRPGFVVAKPPLMAPNN